LGPAGFSVLAGLITWLFVNVPVMLINFQNWRRFLDLNTERAIDWGTSWYVGRFIDSDILKGVAPEFWNNVPLVTNLSLALFALACLGIAALGLLAKTPPRLGQLAFLVVAVFLLTNKVWSQQFTLWLLPLVVLARPKWGAFLAWQLAEVGYFLCFYWELLGASGKKVIPEGVFVLASMARLITVIVLVVLVIGEILHPERDVVRQTYADTDTPDPDGGVLNDDYRVKVTPSSVSLRSMPSPSPGAVSAPS
jgi:uncharacterized membrane protein